MTAEKTNGPEKFINRTPVEAIRWTGSNMKEVGRFAPGSWVPHGDRLVVDFGGSARPGDWVVKDESGRVWAMSAADFTRAYRRDDASIQVPVYLRPEVVSAQEAQKLSEEGISAIGYVVDDERVARLAEGLRTVEIWTGNGLLIAGLVNDGIIRQEDVK